jgi:hypothetical protein
MSCGKHSTTTIEENRDLYVCNDCREVELETRPTKTMIAIKKFIELSTWIKLLGMVVWGAIFCFFSWIIFSYLFPVWGGFLTFLTVVGSGIFIYIIWMDMITSDYWKDSRDETHKLIKELERVINEKIQRGKTDGKPKNTKRKIRKSKKA